MDGRLLQCHEEPSTIDARYVVRNSQKVATYCKKAKNETLMSAIQRTWR